MKNSHVFYIQLINILYTCGLSSYDDTYSKIPSNW